MPRILCRVVVNHGQNWITVLILTNYLPLFYIQGYTNECFKIGLGGLRGNSKGDIQNVPLLTFRYRIVWGGSTIEDKRQSPCDGGANIVMLVEVKRLERDRVPYSLSGVSVARVSSNRSAASYSYNDIGYPTFAYPRVSNRRQAPSDPKAKM